ncbi:MAG TPA: glutathione ABC transporter permease GsiD [Actinobacteria bacterium]|nr:glutathione ABC transporter permease GsiD [Actinomycetota bacterium]
MHETITKIIEAKPSLARTFRRLIKHRLVVTGAAVILILLFIGVFASFIAPHSPIEQNLSYRLMLPNMEYPLGTDNLGRCILSRLMYGARISLRIGIIVVGINSIVGIILGLTAGYFGGIIDELIMRVVDIMLALPGIIVALLIAGLLGPSLFNIMLALTIIGWTSYARVVRGSVLSVKEREFIEAERALGAGNMRIIFCHVLPNVLAPILVMATLGMGHVILTASALSFLGLGAQPPIAEWGSMLNSGRAFMRTAPHLMVFPGLAIMVSVLAFNFLGDGLRDVLFKS